MSYHEVAQNRIRALRFEEKGLWPDAARAWLDASAALADEEGPICKAFAAEMTIRGRVAAAKAEDLGLEEPAYRLKDYAEAQEKPQAERDPGAVSHPDPGNNIGATGAL